MSDNLRKMKLYFLLDSKGEISKKQIAHASQNIQDIFEGKTPDIYYGADISYMNYLNNYLIDHKNHINGKENEFMALIQVMTPIVQDNMKRVAQNTPVEPPPEQPAPKDKSKPMGKLSPYAGAKRASAVMQ